MRTWRIRRIMVINADDTGETELPALTVDDAQPAFLPSGALVFAGRASRRKLQNLYTAAIDGTGLRQLTRSGGSQPAPCSDGSIAFIRDHDLYLWLASGRVRELARGVSWPDCSPNNRQIVFLHKQDLYVISNVGRRMRQLTHHGIAVGAATFSPNGKLIAFSSEHHPSSHWRPVTPRKFCADGVCTGLYLNSYLQIIDRGGREHGKPLLLGTSGSDQDGFPWQTDPGGISWQVVK